MSGENVSRGASRNRHGRSLRRPVFSNLFRNRLSQGGGFEQVVTATCEYLISAWPEELRDLNWQIINAPAITPEDKLVRRWGIRKSTMTIFIYRLPIERMGHHRRHDMLHERMHIEENVFAAVGHLLDKDPWELEPERYR